MDIREKEHRLPDGDADSGVDETTQGVTDGEPAESRTRPTTASRIPRKTPPESPMKRARPHQPADASRRMPRSKSVPKPFSSVSLSVPETVKKVPMNKVVVGHAPSPNLMKVQSRIGSLANNDHKAGGGNVKIESRKLEWNVTSKVGSTKNLKHKAGGGKVKIHDAKLEIKAESRIGSLANVGHRAGGGEKKIFDDKEYSRQMREFQSATGPSSTLNSARGSTHGSLGSNLHQSPEPHRIDEQF